MEVWEKMNYLIAEREMSKKEFINKLLDLKPILKSTGETPSYNTINGYLYGKRELKVELIPYNNNFPHYCMGLLLQYTP